MTHFCKQSAAPPDLSDRTWVVDPVSACTQLTLARRTAIAMNDRSHRSGVSGMGRFEPVAARGSGRSRGEPVRSRHWGQLNLVQLTFGPPPAAAVTVSLMALTASTPASPERLLTLHCCRPPPWVEGQQRVESGSSQAGRVWPVTNTKPTVGPPTTALGHYEKTPVMTRPWKTSTRITS